MEIMLFPFKFVATPQPALVVGEENLVIGFGPPYFRHASAIAGCTVLANIPGSSEVGTHTNCVSHWFCKTFYISNKRSNKRKKREIDYRLQSILPNPA